MSTQAKDWIPGRDDDFYNLVKTIMRILEEVTEMGGISQENWKHWLIPEAKFKTLKEHWTEYQKLYDKAQSKKDRTAGDVEKHRKKRDKELEPYLRKFVQQYIRHEDQIDDGDKVRMQIIPRDEVPSPEHGSHLTTLAPDVFLKNMGGAKIDARFKRPQDQTRSSMPKGYEAELRYVIDTPLPPDPDDIPSKTTVTSSKTRFQINAGMPNKGKTLRSYGRWKHKINRQFDSPWTTVMEITIA